MYVVLLVIFLYARK